MSLKTVTSVRRTSTGKNAIPRVASQRCCSTMNALAAVRTAWRASSHDLAREVSSADPCEPAQKRGAWSLLRRPVLVARSRDRLHRGWRMKCCGVVVHGRVTAARHDDAKLDATGDSREALAKRGLAMRDRPRERRIIGERLAEPDRERSLS
jgi:hypothetical protein